MAEGIENTSNTFSVKVSARTYDSLNDEKTRIRRETGGKTTLQELLDEAWDSHIRQREGREKESLESSVPPDYRPLLKKFAAILASGDDPIIQAAASNVVVFYDRLRPAGRKER